MSLKPLRTPAGTRLASPPPARPQPAPLAGCPARRRSCRGGSLGNGQHTCRSPAQNAAAVTALAARTDCRDPGGSAATLAAPPAMSCRMMGSEALEQAQDRAVRPNSSIARMSAPSSSSAGTNAALPAGAAPINGVLPVLCDAFSKLAAPRRIAALPGHPLEFLEYRCA
jgi:hypothetical protein